MVALASLPHTTQLKNGTNVTLRPMTAGDAEAMLAFARKLPADDVLFLRSDITQPEGIAYWVANIEQETTITVVAETPEGIAGYASVHRNPARWTRRIGELRVNVGAAHRGSGLGRLLVSTIVDVAGSLGLKKLSAQMTIDQDAARKVFGRLGFQVEAILGDWVEDAGGRPRDLIVMAYDLEGLTDRLDEPVGA